MSLGKSNSCCADVHTKLILTPKCFCGPQPSLHLLTSPGSFREAPEKATPKLDCSISPAQDRPNEPTAVGEVSFVLKMPHLYSAPWPERSVQRLTTKPSLSSLCFRVCAYTANLVYTFCYPVEFEPNICKDITHMSSNVKKYPQASRRSRLRHRQGLEDQVRL